MSVQGCSRGPLPGIHLLAEGSREIKVKGGPLQQILSPALTFGRLFWEGLGIPQRGATQEDVPGERGTLPALLGPPSRVTRPYLGQRKQKLTVHTFFPF